MSATLAFNAAPSGGQKANQVVTVTAAGHAGTTAYVLQVAHPHGGTEQHSFTTSGGGGATITFTPSVNGTFTVTSVLAVQPAVATASLNVGGTP